MKAVSNDINFLFCCVLEPINLEHRIISFDLIFICALTQSLQINYTYEYTHPAFVGWKIISRRWQSREPDAQKSFLHLVRCDFSRGRIFIPKE